MVLRQLDICMQKHEVGPLPHMIYVNSKWINDLYARAKITKLLEESIDVNLHDLRMGNCFLYKAPKVQVTKEKT